MLRSMTVLSLLACISVSSTSFAGAKWQVEGGSGTMFCISKDQTMSAVVTSTSKYTVVRLKSLTATGGSESVSENAKVEFLSDDTSAIENAPGTFDQAMRFENHFVKFQGVDSSKNYGFDGTLTVLSWDAPKSMPATCFTNF